MSRTLTPEPGLDRRKPTALGSVSDALARMTGAARLLDAVVIAAFFVVLPMDRVGTFDAAGFTVRPAYPLMGLFLLLHLRSVRAGFRAMPTVALVALGDRRLAAPHVRPEALPRVHGVGALHDRLRARGDRLPSRGRTAHARLDRALLRHRRRLGSRPYRGVVRLVQGREHPLRLARFAPPAARALGRVVVHRLLPRPAALPLPRGQAQDLGDPDPPRAGSHDEPHRDHRRGRRSARPARGRQPLTPDRRRQGCGRCRRRGGRARRPGRPQLPADRHGPGRGLAGGREARVEGESDRRGLPHA